MAPETKPEPGLESVRAFLSLGSNLGDRAGYLRSAVAALDRSEGDFLAVGSISPVYETEPVEVEGDQPEYLNCVVETHCRMGLLELLRYCQGVEAALGRSGKGERAPRTVDVDVLLYGDAEMEEPGIRVPHRGITRAFNLVALAALDPDLRVPGLGAVGGLLTEAGDGGPAGVRGVRELGPLEEL